MLTTTAISRCSSELRRNLHRLNYLNCRSVSTSPSSPLPSLYPSSSSSSCFQRSPPLINSVDLRVQEVKSFGLYSRYLSTSTVTPPSSGGDSSTVPESKSSPASGAGGSSQDSQQSGTDAGISQGSQQSGGDARNSRGSQQSGGDAGNSRGSQQSGTDAGNSQGSQKSGTDAGNSQGSQQSGGDAGKSVRGSPVSWMSLFLSLLTGAGLIFYFDREKKRHIEEIKNASTTVRQGPSVGQAAIGGPFKLVNHEGKNVTEKDFLGKWTVMYFGFTHCPDICPDELQKLAAAVDKIKKKSGIEIIPVFISVDPERDTVEQVSEYVQEFHPKLIGLTGDPEEIRKVARSYRVYYMKTTEEDSDYLVDHSIVMYLMSPKMEFVKFYGKNNDINGLVDGIIKEVKAYKK